NYLAHASGDAINAVLAAAGYNFRRLLAWLEANREKRKRGNPIFGVFFFLRSGSGAYRAGPLGGEGVGEKNFLSGSKIVTAKWRAKTIWRLAATNKCLAKRNRSGTGAQATPLAVGSGADSLLPPVRSGAGGRVGSWFCSQFCSQRH